MTIVKAKRSTSYKAPDPLESLYFAIPEILLKLTKAGICRWGNHGCTLFSHSILKESDKYVGFFKNSPNPDIKLLISDDDCILIVRENLISNSAVCRLKNYVLNGPNAKVDTVASTLMKTYTSLEKMFPECKEKEGS